MLHFPLPGFRDRRHPRPNVSSRTQRSSRGRSKSPGTWFKTTKQSPQLRPGGSRPTKRPDKNKPGTPPKIEEGHASKDLPATCRNYTTKIGNLHPMFNQHQPQSAEEKVYTPCTPNALQNLFCT